MKTNRLRTTLGRTLAVTLATGSMATLGAATLAAPAQAADAPLNCGPDSLVEKELANGSSWRMCARIHPLKGLVLEQVEFKPPTDREYSGYKRVIDSLGISQLNVPYDTGHVQYNDITSYGFGKQYLMPQTENTCSGTAMDVNQSFTYRSELIERTVPGICVDEIDTGLMTHAQENQLGGGVLYADQGTALEVQSIAKISWYEYQQQVKFDDHGQIDVGLGATGDIAPGAPGSSFFGTDPLVGWPLGGEKTSAGEETYAGSHWHNAVYRVDFGIDKGERQVVEQYDFTNPGDGTRAPILHGRGTDHQRAFHAIPGQNMDELSWFRVKNPSSLNPDGHARSYEIVNQNYQNKTMPAFEPSISFTNNRACEEYASANLNAGCPGESVLDYVANDNHPLTDPVAWVTVGFHHTDKDEDQSPMPIHWQRFQIVPRDFFAQKPTMTEARSCVNGATGGAVNSTTRPCIATNTELPTVSADAATPVAGTVLTATPGVWNVSRTTWNHQYLWFRDGEPIVDDEVAATGETYTLTEADLGSSITVKVTASQTGYPSGVAESAAVVVGGGPTPTPSPTANPTASPTASPTATPTAKPTVAPKPTVVASSLSAKNLKVKVKKNGVLVVTGKAGKTVPTGTVTVKVKGKVVGKAKFVKGKATVKLKKFTKTGKYTATITYPGTKTVKASKRVVTIRVVK